MKETEMYERTAKMKHIIRANSDIKNFLPGEIAEAVHKIELDTLAPRLRVSIREG